MAFHPPQILRTCDMAYLDVQQTTESLESDHQYESPAIPNCWNHCAWTRMNDRSVSSFSCWQHELSLAPFATPCKTSIIQQRESNNTLRFYRRARSGILSTISFCLARFSCSKDTNDKHLSQGDIPTPPIFSSPNYFAKMPTDKVVKVLFWVSQISFVLCVMFTSAFFAAVLSAKTKLDGLVLT